MRQGVVTAGGPRREVLVCLQGIHNHSHAAASEFEQMRHRLADALSRAGAHDLLPMRFVADPDGPCDFELTGTAYLVTASGFDQWEIYLDLRPAEGAWSLWRPEGALRLLRQPRNDEPELRLIPLTR